MRAQEYSTGINEVTAECLGHVLHLKLNRPERKNALSLAMYQALADAINWANREPQVRVVVLSSTSDTFCAGNDLADFMNNPTISSAHPSVQFIDAVRLSQTPMVVKATGHVVGIGATLLMHVDFACVSADAHIQMPFVNLGLAPENASSLYLAQIIGRQRANRLLLLGEPISGTQAAEWGLITHAAPPDELDEYVEKLIQRLVNQPPNAVRRAKALLKVSTELAEDAALNAEYAALAEGLASEECKEAITAFYEKRKPDFSRF